MSSSHLVLHAQPRMERARLVLGLSGWMDGGDVSTGTVQYLTAKLDADLLAEIQPESFYIYSFPGSMEITALFRPHTKIADGLIVEYEPPRNTFHVDEPNRLILFQGREPNLRWTEYAECVFDVVEAFDVQRVYFIGSVAGVAPHTREPRLYSSVSDEAMKAELEPFGVRFSSYEGPASVATYLTRLAARRGVPMATLVAEIPAYVQGQNPKCIEAVTRRLAAMLDLPIHLDDLRAAGEAFETKLNEAVPKRAELVQLIHKLESDYDNEVFDTQMGDLKAWLQRQGIRLD